MTGDLQAWIDRAKAVGIDQILTSSSSADRQRSPGRVRNAGAKTAFRCTLESKFLTAVGVARAVATQSRSFNFSTGWTPPFDRLYAAGTCNRQGP